MQATCLNLLWLINKLVERGGAHRLRAITPVKVPVRETMGNSEQVALQQLTTPPVSAQKQMNSNN